MGFSPPLGALDMTLQAGNGLLLTGILACPEVPPPDGSPLAIPARQYPATSDSFAPPVYNPLL